MPRKAPKTDATSGTTAAGPAQGEVHEPAQAVLDNAPTTFAENDANLQSERKAAEGRARKVMGLGEQHVYGLDAQPADAPRFDPKDPKHKPSQRDLEVAAGEDDEHPEGSTESGGDVSSDDTGEAQWAQPHGDARVADEEKTGEPESDQDYEAALKALRLDFGDDASHLIKGLEPEQIKALGKKARLRQRDVSLRLQELGEAKGPRENGQAKPEVKEQPVLQPTADWTARLKQTAEVLGLDEEATGVLGDTIRSAALDMVEGLGLVNQNKAASNAIAFLIEDRARTRLGQDLPALVSDAAAWKKVVSKAQLLLKSQDYNIDEAFDDAADLVTRGELSQARRQDKSQARRRQTQSQPTSPRSRTSPPSAKITEEERERRIFYKQWTDQDQARWAEANKDRRIL